MRRALTLLVLLGAARAEDDPTRIELLLKLLQAGDEEMRSAAAFSLAAIGAPAAAQVARLLDDPWPAFRASACTSLREMGAAARPFAGRLAALAEKDDTEDVRDEALWALAAVDPAAAVAIVRMGLADAREGSRIAAELAVRDLGAEAFGFLDSPDEGVRGAAVRALGELDPPPVEAAAKLLAGGKAVERIAAADLLEAWGERSRPALPAILAACADADGGLAAEALETAARVDAAAALDVAVKSLERSEADVRAAAARLLEGLGEAARRAAPALVRVVADPDRSVRMVAADALGKLRVPEAAGPLEDLLDDPDEVVRVAAAEALWRVTGKTEPALRTLRDLLAQSDHGFIRSRALGALGAMGTAAKAALGDVVLLAGSVEKGSDEPGDFAAAIAAMGDPEKAWAILVAAYADEDGEIVAPPVRLPIALLVRELADERGAYLAAAMLRECHADAVAPVAEVLAHERAEARRRAASLLSSLGKGARPAVPALLRALADSDALVRRAAADALEATGERSDAVRGGLAAALDRETDPGTRLEVGKALWKAGGDRGRLVPVFVSALVEEPLAKEAAWSLGGFVEADPSVVALLTPHLAEPRVRVALASAIADDAPEAALPVLRDAIKRGEPVDVSGFWRADVALPLCREALRSGSAEVRGRAVEAMLSVVTSPLEEHVIEADAAATDWAPLLRDPSPEVRAKALEALRAIGPMAAPAVPALIPLLDGEGRCEAAHMLGGIGRPAKAAAPKLAELLRKDEDRNVRIAAAKALAAMGAEAGDHAKALQEAAAGDPDPAVRLAAASAARWSRTGGTAIGVGGGR